MTSREAAWQRTAHISVELYPGVMGPRGMGPGGMGPGGMGPGGMGPGVRRHYPSFQLKLLFKFKTMCLKGYGKSSSERL